MYWNLEAFAPFSPVRWLTLTWDVLKSGWQAGYKKHAGTINTNMRCIEMLS